MPTDLRTVYQTRMTEWTVSITFAFSSSSHQQRSSDVRLLIRENARVHQPSDRPGTNPANTSGTNPCIGVDECRRPRRERAGRKAGHTGRLVQVASQTAMRSVSMASSCTFRTVKPSSLWFDITGQRSADPITPRPPLRHALPSPRARPHGARFRDASVGGTRVARSPAIATSLSPFW